MNVKEYKKKNIFNYQMQTFAYAFNGLRTFFEQELKATLHTIAAILAILAGFLLKINQTEWLIIILAIALVFLAELTNTAIEKLADIIEPDINRKIKEIKDVAAGAVLVTASAALLSGLLIFLPKLIALF